MRLFSHVFGLSPAVWCVLAGVGLPFLAASRQCQAQIVYSNFDSSNTPRFDTVNSDFVSNYGSGTARMEAMRFTPSNTTAFVAAEVALQLANAYTDRAVVSIYSDNSGLPGTALESIVAQPVPQSPLGPGLTVASATHPILTGGTQYWLAVSLDPADSFTSVLWYRNSIGDSDTIAASFSPNNNPNWFLTGNAVTRPAFSILGNENLVPEPATFSLLGLAALHLLYRRPRRANAN